MATKRRTTPQPELKGKTILLCVSASIAAYRACEIVRDLKAKGADVYCLMTRDARHFITPLTLRALSANPVFDDPFTDSGSWNILHTTLADKADLILIAPATANLIARLAGGFADDMVTSVVLASRAQVLMAPAMNDNMFSHALTQNNINKLRQLGYQVVTPIKGDLVCGREGVGHIADTDTIVQEAVRLLHA